MRRVFEHSWKLLSETDQQFLRALAIFRGGFAFDAVRRLAGASLTDLARLIDSSWVQVKGDGRYDLHLLIAQYLHEHLEASGELSQVSTAHASYYAEFLHVRREDVMGRRQLAALNEIQTDFENVSTAWEWLINNHDYDHLGKAWETLAIYSRVRGRDEWCGHVRKLPLMTDQAHPVMTYMLLLQDVMSEDEIRYVLTLADKFQDVRARALALREMGVLFVSRHEYAAGLGCVDISG